MNNDPDEIYASCQAANDALGPCPRPLVGSDGGHWWYIDHEAFEEMCEQEDIPPYVPCVCKTCPQKMRLSDEAEEYPL